MFDFNFTGGLKLNNNNKMATSGMILGLVSIIGWLIPFLGVILTILAIVFSALGLKNERKEKAIAGLVLGIIFS